MNDLLTKAHADLTEIQFTVDAELLRELGERLVGRQYIALAELVKNSYDADATKVEICIGVDSIEVSDNGHGMTFDDFEGRWMRVGSTHKVSEMRSPRLKRPLTGSKGVGRLAVQFLASNLELTTVPSKDRVPRDSKARELYTLVDWDSAVRSGELTQATALYDLSEPGDDSQFPSGKPHGTVVRLLNLKHEWNPQEFEDLAREIWFLQPPFRSLTRDSDTESSDFAVEFFADDPTAVSLFNNQMSRILDLYTSRIVGRLDPTRNPSGGVPKKRKILLSLQLEDQAAQPYEYEVPVQGNDHCLIESLDFEIRIFTLQNRQPYGIPVRTAREYMRQWGGVHIYDAGFRIPYAGPDADWLRLEFDHSHRLTQSQLLPDDLNVRMGLNNLPTNSRVLGVVNIDTTREARSAERSQLYDGQHLQIQVSRDRLVTNGAFRQLRDAVRFALDYYSNRLAALRLQERSAQRDVQTPSRLVENVWDVLEQHKEDIPTPIAKELSTELTKTVKSIRDQSEWTARQSGLLGAMATAGATAIALDHQFTQQLGVLEHHASSLEEITEDNPDLKDLIGPISSLIRKWIRDARATRAIFSPVSDERNRTSVARFLAKPLIRDMARDMRAILRGVDVDVSGIDRTLSLPETSYPVWMAIFHNVLMNASNAMLDSEIKRISASSFRSGNRRGLHIQDTGVGIKLANAESLFEPLSRDLEISRDRRALGYGGAGLGLSIVRMLAIDLKANVQFVEPESNFNTCFEISWSEKS